MDFHLKPLGKTCAGTGQPLQPGSECHSVLVEQNGELQRLDFSPTGWKGPPPHTVGYWKTLVPKLSVAESRKLDTEQLLRYFEQLAEEASPNTESQRYVLALFLLQKRKLQLDGSRWEDDREFLQLSGTHGEGTFEVPNLQLPDAETQQLQQQLRLQLATEWSA